MSVERDMDEGPRLMGGHDGVERRETGREGEREGGREGGRERRREEGREGRRESLTHQVTAVCTPRFTVGYHS